MYLKIIIFLLTFSFTSLVYGADSFSNLTSGYGHTCLTKSKNLYCWGWNFYGQIGNGSKIDAPDAQPVIKVTENVKAVDAGSQHICAILNGGVKCWGQNIFGSLGLNNREDVLAPEKWVYGLAANAGVTQLSAGRHITCAVVDGGVKCWGWNWNCQLGQKGCQGQGDDDYNYQPQWVDGLGPNSGAKQVSVGINHACAIVNGGVKCWGNTLYGALGDGIDRISFQDIPVDAIGLGPSAQVTHLSVGEHHTCAISFKRVLCWGRSFYIGQKQENLAHAYRPIEVTGLGQHNFTTLSTFGNTTCATDSRELWCWGSGGEWSAWRRAHSQLFSQTY